MSYPYVPNVNTILHYFDNLFQVWAFLEGQNIDLLTPSDTNQFHDKLEAIIMSLRGAHFF